MKKFLLLPFAMCCVALFAQQTSQKKTTKKVVAKRIPSDSIPAPKAPETKYTDNVDDRMKGPNGEKIYIGTNGGRYYLKANKKVYVPYGNKTKKVKAVTAD